MSLAPLRFAPITEPIRVVHVPTDQRHRRNVRVHPNDFDVDALLFEKTPGLSDADGKVREIVVGYSDSYLV